MRWYRGEVVVGGIELGALHPAVQHTFKPLQNCLLWRKQAIPRDGVKSFNDETGGPGRPIGYEAACSLPPRGVLGQPRAQPGVALKSALGQLATALLPGCCQRC